MPRLQGLRQRKAGDGTGIALVLFFLAFALAAGAALMHVVAQNNDPPLANKAQPQPPRPEQKRIEAPFKPLAPPSARREAGPFFYLFVVLDDAGAALEQLEPFYAFPQFDKLSFAILPHLKHTQEVVRTLAQRNAAYILHMPMQPLGAQDPGPFALRVDYAPKKIARLALQNIENIPQLIGVNNHMGSAATQNKQLMHTLLTLVKKQGLFFMDSRTSPRSVARLVARSVDLPLITRDVFLDNKEDLGYIQQQLQEAVHIAREKGFAVVIGHVTKPATAQALRASYSSIQSQGAAFASLREYFHLVH